MPPAGLNLVGAPLAADAERYLTDEIRAMRRADPLQPVVVVVGSQLHAEHLQTHLAKSLGGIFNCHILTFRDLARNLALPARMGDLRPHLPAGGQVGLAVGACTAGSPMGELEAVADRPGFALALARTMEDLDEAGVGELDFAFGEAPQRLAALSDLRRAYLEGARACRTAADDWRDSAAHAADFPARWGTDRLFLVGLYDFTGLQGALLEALAGHVNITAVVPAPQTSDGSGGYLYAVRRLAGLRDRTGAAPITAAPSERFGNDLSSALFCFPLPSAASSPPAPELWVSSPANPAAEVREVVGMVNELLLWEGILPGRVGILLWHPHLYADRFREAFSEAGLPLCDALGKPLSDLSPGRTLLDFLAFDHRRLTRRELMDWLASRPVNLGGASSEPDGSSPATPDPAMWERMSIKSGLVSGGRQPWLAALDGLLNSRNAPDAAAEPVVLQGRRFRTFVERLFDDLETLAACDNRADLYRGLTEVAARYLPAGEATIGIMEVLKRLHSWAEAHGGVPVPHELRTVAGEALRATVWGRRARHLAAVVLTDKMGARGLTFDVLFIPGLTQDAVPVKPREDPLLPDHLRRSLNRRLSPQATEDFPLPLQGERVGEERLLFALAVGSVSRRLVLTWPRTDGAGKQTYPSRFLLEACRVAARTSVSPADLPHYPFFRPPALDGGDLPERRLFRAADVLSPLARGRLGKHRLSTILLKQAPEVRTSLSALAARKSSEKYSPWDGLTDPSPDTALRTFSVSRLETYAECPHQYYFKYLVVPELWQEPERRLEVPPEVVGSIAHQVLYRVYDEARRRLKRPVAPSELHWDEAGLWQAIGECIDQARPRHPLPPALWDFLHRRLDRRLAGFLKAEAASSAPTLFDRGEVPIRWQVPSAAGSSAGLVLTGRVDRVDVTPDGQGLRVIDYKTGRKAGGADLESGANLQLHAYFLALLKEYPKSRPESSSAEYLQIDRTGAYQRVTCSGADILSRLDEVCKIVTILVEGVTAGYFPPSPRKGEKTCDRCDYNRLCDRRGRRTVSAAADPLLAKLLSIRTTDETGDDADG